MKPLGRVAHLERSAKIPAMATPPTDEEKKIAKWMFDEFVRDGRLSQHRAAREIRMNFGEKHLYKNANRNWAINKAILEEFRRLGPEDKVWSRGSQIWRRRRPTDPEGTLMLR